MSSVRGCVCVSVCVSWGTRAMNLLRRSEDHAKLQLQLQLNWLIYHALSRSISLSLSLYFSVCLSLPLPRLHLGSTQLPIWKSQMIVIRRLCCCCCCVSFHSVGWLTMKRAELKQSSSSAQAATQQSSRAVQNESKGRQNPNALFFCAFSCRPKVLGALSRSHSSLSLLSLLSFSVRFSLLLCRCHD